MNQSKKNKFYSQGKNKYANKPFQGNKNKEKDKEVKNMSMPTDDIWTTNSSDGIGIHDFSKFSEYVSKSILSSYSMPKSMSFEIKSEKSRVEQKQEPKKIMRPKEIKVHLDQYVIGQEEAKIALSVAVYNHYKRIETGLNDNDGIEIQKSNILMLGNSGSGKTLLAQTIAKILNVPFTSVDATAFTPAGYVGKDIETILENLLKSADGNRSKAETGIVYIDEFDKISSGNNASNMAYQTKGFGGDIQASFLKLIEGSEMETKSDSRSSMFGSSSIKIDTKNILFICGGAFAGIENLIEKNKDDKVVGFGAINKKSLVEDINVWDKIGTEEVIKYGMMPEIAGRLPVLLKLKPLEKDDLVNILTQPKNAIVKQYQKLLSMDGIYLDFSIDALELIAELAIKNKTGARGLRGILEKVMTKLMFNIPDDEYERKCVLTSEHIRNNIIPELCLTVDMSVMN